VGIKRGCADHRFRKAGEQRQRREALYPMPLCETAVPGCDDRVWLWGCSTMGSSVVGSAVGVITAISVTTMSSALRHVVVMRWCQPSFLRRAVTSIRRPLTSLTAIGARRPSL
jgi:hypothetical protein